MKSTGIVREVDDLGRVVIRDKASLQFNKKEVEIFTDGEHVIVRHYSQNCLLCGEIEGTISIHEKKIFKQCVDALMEQH